MGEELTESLEVPLSRLGSLLNLMTNTLDALAGLAVNLLKSGFDQQMSPILFNQEIYIINCNCDNTNNNRLSIGYFA